MKRCLLAFVLGAAAAVAAGVRTQRGSGTWSSSISDVDGFSIESLELELGRHYVEIVYGAIR